MINNVIYKAIESMNLNHNLCFFPTDKVLTTNEILVKILLQFFIPILYIDRYQRFVCASNCQVLNCHTFGHYTNFDWLLFT